MILKRWFRRRWNDPTVTKSLHRGNVARDRGEWVTSARAYRAYLDAHPENVAVWIQYGHALKESGDLFGALDAYRRSSVLSPDDLDRDRIKRELEDRLALLLGDAVLRPALKDAESGAFDSPDARTRVLDVILLRALETVSAETQDGFRTSAERLALVEKRIEHTASQNEQLARELPRFVQPIADQRTEIAALVNRHETVAREQSQLSELVHDQLKSVELKIADHIAEQQRLSLSAASLFEVEHLARQGAIRQESTEALLKVLTDQVEELREAQWAPPTPTAEAGGPPDVPESRTDHQGHGVAAADATGAHPIDPLRPGYADPLCVQGGTTLESTTGEVPHQKTPAQEFDRLDRLYIAPTDDGLMILKRGDLVSSVLTETGVWDPHVREVMDGVRRVRNGLSIDVGAHFGAVTLSMARRFERVLSFEPNDFSFNLLRANVQLNGLFNVTCRNHPLFSAEVEMSLARQEMQEVPITYRSDGSFDPMSTQNIAGYAFSPNGTNVSKHGAVTIDSLGLEDVVFMKVDAQGCDGEILLGASEMISKCRPVIVFEWEELLSRAFSVGLSDVENMLQSLGYIVHVLKRHNDKQIDFVAHPIK